MHSIKQETWGRRWKRSGEKLNQCIQCDLKRHSGDKSNKCNQCNFASTWPDTFEVAQWRKVNRCNQCDYASFGAGNVRNHLITHKRVFLCSFKKFEITFDNTQWRKVKSMQPMPFCLLWSECFEAGILASSTFFGSSKVPMLSKICIVFGKNSQRIRIRIIFGLRKSPEYEYYSVSKSHPNTNTSIRPQVFE